MDVSNLEVGRTYANYKVMCRVLEVEEKEGSSRKTQIESWSRYFNYRREGNKYIIEEVFEIPKEDTRKKGNTIFGDITKLLIIDMLAEQEGRLIIGRTKLIKDLGIANDNYNRCRSITAKLASYLSIDVNVIYDFYNTNNSNFKSIIEKALNSLMDERRIIYQTVIKIKELGSYTYRNATKDELQTIVNVEGNMLTKMGYSSISEIRMTKDWGEFKKVTGNIIKTMTTIDYYFDAYDIVIHEERIIKGRDELLELILEKSKREEYRKELNSRIVNSIDKNANNRHIKAKSNAGTNKDKMRAKSGYVEDIGKLSNALIKIDKDSIVDSVNKEVVVKNKSIKSMEVLDLDETIKQHIDEQLEGLFD